MTLAHPHRAQDEAQEARLHTPLHHHACQQILHGELVACACACAGCGPVGTDCSYLAVLHDALDLVQHQLAHEHLTRDHLILRTLGLVARVVGVSQLQKGGKGGEGDLGPCISALTGTTDDTRNTPNIYPRQQALLTLPSGLNSNSMNSCPHLHAHQNAGANDCSSNTNDTCVWLKVRPCLQVTHFP